MTTPIYILAGQSNAATLYGNNGGQTLAQALAQATGSADIATRLVFSNGAPLTYGRAEPDWASAGELPAQLLSTIRAALDSDGNSVLSGILWVQGEGDSWAVGRPAQYEARLCALVNWLEEELAPYGDRAAGFRISVLALSADAPAAAGRSQWQAIREAQLAIDHPRISVIDPDTLATGPGSSVPSASGGLFQSDGLHYAAAANAALLEAMTRGMPLQLVGTAAGDRLSGRWAGDVLEGGGGNDALSGNAGNDTLWGGTGSDILAGGSGRDVLVGGRSADNMWGGAGADRFVFLFAAAEDRAVVDRIGDFSRGIDRIELAGIDANATVAGNQAFRLVAGPGAGAATLWTTAVTDGLLLQFDTGGDGVADGHILVAGVTSLLPGDLLL